LREQLVQEARRDGVVSAEAAEVDQPLVLITAVLCAFGLVMVYSASQALAVRYYGNPAYFLERQAIWLAVGAAGLLVATRLDYHAWRTWAPRLLAFTLLLLVLVLVPGLGHSSQGARRWLGIGPLLGQPAELAKLTLIVYVAYKLEQWGSQRLRQWSEGVVPLAAVFSVVTTLVTLEKDLSTTVILGLCFLVIVFVAGIRFRHLVVLSLGMAAAFLLLIRSEPYRWQRMLTFLNPWQDPLGSGFQTLQSLIALGSGGLFGVGLGHSIQKYLWLPEVHTDFIFAIIGEELGIFGTVLTVLLFTLFAYRGYRIALRAPDRFGMLAATGITSWITFQAIINVAAVTGSLPITGVPLPFVSSGGSSLAASLTGVGVLLAISRQGTVLGTVRRARADLGWRDRRSRVAGDRHGTGARRV
jgi:cell division protein FtsW